MADQIAAVLIRGLLGTRKEVRDTLFMLHLRKKHACVVLPNNAASTGMLQKSKDFVTYGPVSDETVAELQKKRKAINEKPLVFNLAPPVGGFERKGIKKTFVQGGALGPRKEIDTLLKKMM